MKHFALALLATTAIAGFATTSFAVPNKVDFYVNGSNDPDDVDDILTITQTNTDNVFDGQINGNGNKVNVEQIGTGNFTRASQNFSLYYGGALERNTFNAKTKGDNNAIDMTADPYWNSSGVAVNNKFKADVQGNRNFVGQAVYNGNHNSLNAAVVGNNNSVTQWLLSGELERETNNNHTNVSVIGDGNQVRSSESFNIGSNSFYSQNIVGSGNDLSIKLNGTDHLWISQQAGGVKLVDREVEQPVFEDQDVYEDQPIYEEVYNPDTNENESVYVGTESVYLGVQPVQVGTETVIVKDKVLVNANKNTLTATADAGSKNSSITQTTYGNGNNLKAFLTNADGASITQTNLAQIDEVTRTEDRLIYETRDAYGYYDVYETQEDGTEVVVGTEYGVIGTEDVEIGTETVEITEAVQTAGLNNVLDATVSNSAKANMSVKGNNNIMKGFFGGEGYRNYNTLQQIGSGNSMNVSAVSSQVFQIGDSNRAEVSQSHVTANAALFQYGNGNYAELQQLGIGGTENYFHIYQEGDENNLVARSAGSDNRIKVLQVGSSNAFGGLQKGSNNSMEAHQYGLNNRISMYQMSDNTGKYFASANDVNNNSFLAIQNGNFNQMDLISTVDDATITGVQNGSHNNLTLSVNRPGGGTLNYTQTGNNLTHSISLD